MDVYTTGGALALEKCFFVAIDWNFTKDEHTLCQPSEMNTSISFLHLVAIIKIAYQIYRVAHQRVDAIWVLGWLQMVTMWQTSEFSAVKVKL